MAVRLPYCPDPRADDRMGQPTLLEDAFDLGQYIDIGRRSDC